MSYRRKVRFEYFEVVARTLGQAPNLPDIKFNFQKWIQIASNLSLEGRTFDYYAEQARLDRVWFRDSENYWFLSFIRLRETNLPSTAYIDKEAEPIDLDDDEYIGEDVNSIYSVFSGILMLQRNKFSLGASGLEKYINLLWNEKDNCTIHLRPIKRKDILDSAFKPGNEYRRLTVRFADMKEKVIRSERKNTSFINLFEDLKSYGAINAEVTVTVGNRKNENLTNETVVDSINDIMENKDVVSKAEIGVKYDNEPLEILDLFSNIMHDFIVFELEKKTSLGSEYAELKMAETFNVRKGDILSVLREE